MTKTKLIAEQVSEQTPEQIIIDKYGDEVKRLAKAIRKKTGALTAADQASAGPGDLGDSGNHCNDQNLITWDLRRLTHRHEVMSGVLEHVTKIGTYCDWCGTNTTARLLILVDSKLCFDCQSKLENKARSFNSTLAGVSLSI